MSALEKSSKLFRTIREVADELSLEPHVLRFWEKEFPKYIKPMQRDNGRRYYRQDDVEKIRHIQSLLHEQGYTIKGAKSVLKSKKSDVAEMPAAPAEAAPARNESASSSLRPQLEELHQSIQNLRSRISEHL